MPKPLGHFDTVGTFTDQDATPSVGEHWRVYQTANTMATTITGFDDVQAGQFFFVQFGDGNTTIDFTGTNLYGNAAVDFAAADGDFMTCFSPDGTNVYCTVGHGTT